MNERTKITAKTPGSKGRFSFPKTKKTGLSKKDLLPAGQILHLQRSVGNREVQRLLKSGTIQAKLTIGQPNDKYEQEADRMADQVMRMPEPKGALVNGHSSLVQRQSTCPDCPEREEIQTKSLADQITPLVQRQVGPDEEEKSFQTKQANNQTPAVNSTIESGINSIRIGGQPLPESTRSFFEPRFGMDFSQVRLHYDSNAAGIARSVNAKAFTTGKDVVFGTGQYSPATTTGKSLLAHELTHVLQQTTQQKNIIQRLSNPDCEVTYSLPHSGECRSGFLHTCNSETVIPASSSALSITVQVDYRSFPGPVVYGKEDFSVQVKKCRWGHHQLIGSRRISRTLPDTLSFSIASVTPGDEYYLRIYSRSRHPLEGSYSISQ